VPKLALWAFTLEQAKRKGGLEGTKSADHRPDHAGLCAGLDAVRGDVLEEAA
jgi:hypothetical protein